MHKNGVARSGIYHHLFQVAWEPFSNLCVGTHWDLNAAIIQIQKSGAGEKTCPRSQGSLVTAYGLKPRVLNSRVFISCTLYYPYACMLSCFNCVWLCVTLRSIAWQPPLSMGFSRQEYWSELPCPPPGDLPDPGIEPGSLTSPGLAGRFFTTNTTWEAHIFLPFYQLIPSFNSIS